MKKVYSKLFDEAKRAGKQAYSPYSKFRVGAAVITRGNKVYTGANVENASYGLSCCAERVAVFKAAAAGERTIKAVAVAGPGSKPVTPCGACRQVIYEFGRNADVIMGGAKGQRVLKIRELLPDAFGARNIGKK